uniref:Uncharacterized protein n=1 Tax=Anguilla anguilla TaxID=7936 RepID=A0A0E9TV02_ANGAN
MQYVRKAWWASVFHFRSLPEEKFKGFGGMIITMVFFMFHEVSCPSLAIKCHSWHLCHHFLFCESACKLQFHNQNFFLLIKRTEYYMLLSFGSI